MGNTSQAMGIQRIMMPLSSWFFPWTCTLVLPFMAWAPLNRPEARQIHFPGAGFTPIAPGDPRLQAVPDHLQGDYYDLLDSIKVQEAYQKKGKSYNIVRLKITLEWLADAVHGDAAGAFGTVVNEAVGNRRKGVGPP